MHDPSKAPPSEWLIRFKPHPAPRMRLFCFPNAGGSAYTFRSWAQRFANDVEVWGVEPPGRYERARQPPFLSASSLVAALLPEIRPLLGIPFAFFGHSMGALLALELSLQARREGLPQPRHLFVSSRPAPHSPVSQTKLHLADEESMWGWVETHGGLSEVLLRDRGFRRLFLQLFRADMELVETFPTEVPEPLDCDVTAVGGSADPLLDASELEGWSEYTSGRFNSHVFGGGHFYLREHEAALTELIGRELRGQATFQDRASRADLRSI